MLNKLSLKLFSAVIVAMLFGSMQIFAQSTVTGGISGTVTDPQGALVPNAAVTATNIGTNAAVTVNTSDDGGYKITNLQPGTYRVETPGVSGFSGVKADRVIVEVGRSTAVDFRLAVGGATAEVNVTAEAPVINTNDNSNATNINETSISELPINGRRASDFVRLTPGVNSEGDFGLNSFRGLSSLLNNSTLDGTDNNNTFFSEERGRTRIQYSVSQAAVREFQVNNTNYSAEYGRAAGGVINTVTKSGTNDFHGEGFFFDRNNKWGARNPTTVLFGQALKPEDVRKQFGGAVGGRIVKDKLFFFVNYDQQTRNFPGLSFSSTPSTLDPITVGLVGTHTCTSSGLAAGETLFCRGITQAQTDTQLAFLRSLNGLVPRNQDQKIFFSKIDWNINARNAFTATYNMVRTDGLNSFQTQPTVAVGAADFGNDFVTIDTFNARLTSTITSSLINEFRFQYGRELARSVIGDLSPGEQALASRGTNLFNGLLPSITFTGGYQFGFSSNFQRNKFPYEFTRQFVDTMTWVNGDHTIKFGTDIKFTRDDIDNLRSGAGAYSYSNVQNLISDLVNPSLKTYTSFSQSFGLAAYTIKTPDYAFFVQDDWRVNPRVTLNLGLRYDYQSFGDSQFPNSRVPTLTAGQTTFTQDAANALVGQTRSIPKDKNNFGPRFGFAIDVFGNNKTTVRGGFGLYYGRVPNTFLSSIITNTGAPGTQLATGTITPTTVIRDPAGNIIPTPTLPGALSAFNPPSTVAITVASPRLENPMVYEGDLIFEHQIAKNMVVSASYIFALGRKLPSFVDRNLNFPTTTRTYNVVGGPLNGQSFTTQFFAGARPISNFLSIVEVQSNSRSEYNGLVLKAERRLTHGLQFQTSYTYARAVDSGQQFATFAPSFPTVTNPYDPSVDYGRSDNDLRHHFIASAVWQIGTSLGWDKSGIGKAIFGGLTLSPIVNIASGRPVNGFLSANPSSPSFGTSNTLLGSGGPQRVFFVKRNKDSRPSTQVVDLRLSKRFHFTENLSLEILAEGFNVFNRSNFTSIQDQEYFFTAATNTLTYNTGQFAGTPAYLTPLNINNTVNFTPRQIQFGARFHF